MWVESLKLDGGALLDGVAMLNEGERLVCFIDNFGSPPTFGLIGQN